MSLQYIRDYYGVPAKRGGRVRYTGGNKGDRVITTEPRLGTITGARGGYLRIRLDGEREAFKFHPTWKLEFL